MQLIEAHALFDDELRGFLAATTELDLVRVDPRLDSGDLRILIVVTLLETGATRVLGLELCTDVLCRVLCACALVHQLENTLPHALPGLVQFADNGLCVGDRFLPDLDFARELDELGFELVNTVHRGGKSGGLFLVLLDEFVVSAATLGGVGALIVGAVIVGHGLVLRRFAATLHLSNLVLQRFVLPAARVDLRIEAVAPCLQFRAPCLGDGDGFGQLSDPIVLLPSLDPQLASLDHGCSRAEIAQPSPEFPEATRLARLDLQAADAASTLLE